MMKQNKIHYLKSVLYCQINLIKFIEFDEFERVVMENVKFTVWPYCWIRFFESRMPANIYLLTVCNRNFRKRCEICSELTINIPERRHWRRSGVFIVNFEHISHPSLVFLLLTLNKKMLARMSSDIQITLMVFILIFFTKSYVAYKSQYDGDRNLVKNLLAWKNLRKKKLLSENQWK